MLTLVTTTQFRKDYKRAKKRGMDLSRLEAVLELLCAEENIARRPSGSSADRQLYRVPGMPYPAGLAAGYEIRKDQLILVASRTGSHADLFGK